MKERDRLIIFSLVKSPCLYFCDNFICKITIRSIFSFFLFSGPFENTFIYLLSIFLIISSKLKGNYSTLYYFILKFEQNMFSKLKESWFQRNHHKICRMSSVVVWLYTRLGKYDDSMTKRKVVDIFAQISIVPENFDHWSLVSSTDFLDTCTEYQ